MELLSHNCKICGGELLAAGENWQCKYCGNIFTEEKVQKDVDLLRSLLDEQKREQVANLRRNLYDAVTAEYISNNDIVFVCKELKKLLPDDFAANFYEIACKDNVKALSQAIRRINVEENYEQMDTVVGFLIRSLQSEFLLPLNDLIERAYKNKDIAKYEGYATAISREAEKLQKGVYETSLPRDVFVAYSGKDMDKVMELVEFLEEQKFTCFVAARNLRHGRGAVENYNAALEDAMTHCKSFVFVSTLNARSFDCDALKIEIPYVMECDTANAPGELRQNYIKIPTKYKKPRVEYRLEESGRYNVADTLTNEFFDGYERVYSAEEVAVRLLKQRTEASVAATAVEAEKFCAVCGAKNGENEKFCNKCGAAEFVDSFAAFETAKLRREMEELKNQLAASVKAATVAVPTPAAPAPKPAPAAVPSTSQGLKYTLLKNNTYEVSGIGNCYDTKLIIPSTYNGKAVTSIGYHAFRGNDRIASVTILEGVTDIGEDAFGFSKSLSFVSLPESIVTIGKGAFCYCPKLTSIKIPSSVTSIDDYAFYNCTTLTGIIIPESVTSVGESVFKDCTSLTSIHIPKGVKSIGRMIVSSCPNLTKITVAAENEFYYSQDNCIIEKASKKLIAGCNKSIIPKNITSIGDGAFWSCTSFASVVIPSGVTIIGEYAFENCTSLTSVTIPNGVKTIVRRAFASCTLLTSVSIPDSVTDIGKEVFSKCKSLSSITIPNSVRNVDSTVFYDCTNLATIHCAAKSKPLGWHVDWNKHCNAKVRWGAFESTSAPKTTATQTPKVPVAKTPEVPVDITSKTYTYQGLKLSLLGNGTYEVTGICSHKDKSIVIPAMYNGKAVTKIGISAFYYCTSLASVTIPDSVTEIDIRAFDGCASLTSITIPSSVTNIGKEAFCNCSSLSVITIPDNVTTIGDSAFHGCTSLASVSLPNSVTKIGSSVFGVCKSLTSISIPNGVTEIGDFMFYGCISLSSISIPNSVTKIGNGAFQYCRSLTSIIIPSSVTDVGVNVFEECTKLEKIKCMANARPKGWNKQWICFCYADVKWGVCPHCGGEYKGLFTKVCSSCGRKKD